MLLALRHKLRLDNHTDTTGHGTEDSCCIGRSKSQLCDPFPKKMVEGGGGKKPLMKLSEESLMREPEEVFNILEKIGEG